MGRLTEVFHYFSHKNLPQSWMESNFYWFRPTYQDQKNRSFLLNEKTQTEKEKKRIIFKSKDLFDIV